MLTPTYRTLATNVVAVSSSVRPCTMNTASWMPLSTRGQDRDKHDRDAVLDLGRVTHVAEHQLSQNGHHEREAHRHDAQMNHI